MNPRLNRQERQVQILSLGSRACISKILAYHKRMKSRRALQGSSLLETLIALSLFSVFALQTVAFCLRLHNLTRQSLYDTKNIVMSEANYHRQHHHAIHYLP